LERSNYIYAISAVKTRFIKIGRSDRIDQRINELATGCPHYLKYVGRWKASEEKETELHRYLDRYRHRGEWFEISQYLEAEPYTDREVEMQARLDLVSADSAETTAHQAATIRRYETIFTELQEAACANERTLIDVIDESDALKDRVHQLQMEALEKEHTVSLLQLDNAEKTNRIIDLQRRLAGQVEPVSLAGWRARAASLFAWLF
jgi:Meiotically up-regulated gene 113